MKKFKSSYSKSMLLSTFLLLALLLFTIYIIANQLVKTPVDSLSFLGYTAVLCFIVFTLLYAFISQIKSVCLTDDKVIIKKMIGQITISRNEIIAVEHKQTLMSDVRLWGITGLFGHMGIFWNKGIGKYSAFVKDGNSMLTIKTKEKCYVVSCDDYEQVLNLLKLTSL